MKLHGDPKRVIGDDVSSGEWAATILNALNHYPSPICIIQEFMKPRSFTHPVFLNDDKSQMKQGGFVCRLILPLIKSKMVRTLQLFARRRKRSFTA